MNYFSIYVFDDGNQIYEQYENIWSIISQKPVKVNSVVFFDYSKQDLIFFDKNCSTFFTS